MNQKATFIFSLWGKVVGKSEPTRSAGWILLSVCVCAHTLQIYTTYTYSIFISCINFTKSLSRDQNIFFSKKKKKKKKRTYSRILFKQNYTSTYFIKTHSEKSICYEFDQWSFFSTGCVWFLPSVKPRLSVSTVSQRVALVSSRLSDGKAKCQLIQSTKRTIH